MDAMGNKLAETSGIGDASEELENFLGDVDEEALQGFVFGSCQYLL